MTRPFALLLVTALALVALPTRAQERNLDIERFRPTPDRNGFLGIPGTRTPGPWAFNAALWMSYASEPLSLRRLDDGTRLPVIRHRVGADVVAGLGITDRIGLVVDVPVVLFQDTDASVIGGPAIAAVAIRDPYAAIRVRILGEGSPAEHVRQEGEGLALQVATTLPFGLENEFAGEGHSQIEAALLGDFRFLDFGLGAVVGYRHRFAAPRLLGVDFENEIYFGAALKVPTILIANLSAIVEIRVDTAVDDEAAFEEASTAVEGDAGLRWAEGDFALTWAVGMGFNGGVGTPGFRGIFGVEIAPRTHDMDGDGIPDDIDECERLPEDEDGHEDEDGCPDPDNDGDLIPDEDDRCPGEAADFERDEDEDGCTDPVRDADRDGIADAADACPDAPEDEDDFEDEDGCPDPDDDGDGIPDADDRCRREAEDADGFEDEDGCPDPDDDGDGVPDEADACPREAEDADGHDDGDGCPDPDDDRDGVLDAHDRCPAEAETINGVEDEDGCPDRGGRVLWRPEGEGDPPGLRGRVRFGEDGLVRSMSIGSVDQLARHLLARWGSRWRITLGVDEAAAREAMTAALVERGVPRERFEVTSDAELGARAVTVARAPGDSEQEVEDDAGGAPSDAPEAEAPAEGDAEREEPTRAPAADR